MNTSSPVINRLVDWVQATRQRSPLLDKEADGLLARLLPLQHRQQQIDSLRDAPLTLGLYGHSSASKRHLLSALLANADGRIEVELGEDTLDYLTQINPRHRSAAPAVRFTQRYAPAVDRYPLLLKLFNESDITQRMIRRYHARPQARIALSGTVAERLEALLPRRQAQVVPGLTAPQVADIARCYQARLRRQHHLDDALWQRMADLLPWLTSSDRAALLAPLFGDDPRLSAEWQRLSDTLRHLGDTQQLLAPASLLADAFFPPVEDFSIPAEPNEARMQGDVPVCPLPDERVGPPVSLPQADLLSLCAEVCLTLSNAPALRNVDIVEIPVQQIESYTDRLQPDTLLVCNAAAGRSEVKTAARALSRWVETTQAADANLPGLAWTITPHDARLFSDAAVDGRVQHLVGQSGRRWGTLQALDARSMLRLQEWLTDALSFERRNRRVSALQAELEQRIADAFHRFAAGHEVAPAEARLQAQELVRSLQANAAHHGDLLAALVPDRHALQQCWQRFQLQRQKQPAGLVLELNLFAEEENTAATGAGPASYALLVQQLWIDNLRRLEHEAQAAGQFGLTRAQLGALCNLLIATGHRLRLGDQLETALNEGDGSMAQQVTRAASALGDFISWLGYAHIAPEDRPESRVNRGLTVFAPAAQATAATRLTRLGEAAGRGNAGYVYDWLVALYTRAVENIDYRHPHDLSDDCRQSLRALLRC